MARIKTDLANTREQEVFNLFAQDTTATVKAVNDDLKAKHGFKMNLRRIYELRRAATAGQPFPPRVSKAKQTTLAV